MSRKYYSSGYRSHFIIGVLASTAAIAILVYVFVVGDSANIYVVALGFFGVALIAYARSDVVREHLEILILSAILAPFLMMWIEPYLTHEPELDVGYSISDLHWRIDDESNGSLSTSLVWRDILFDCTVMHIRRTGPQDAIEYRRGNVGRVNIRYVFRNPTKDPISNIRTTVLWSINAEKPNLESTGNIGVAMQPTYVYGWPGALFLVVQNLPPETTGVVSVQVDILPHQYSEFVNGRIRFRFPGVSADEVAPSRINYHRVSSLSAAQTERDHITGEQLSEASFPPRAVFWQTGTRLTRMEILDSISAPSEECGPVGWERVFRDSTPDLVRFFGGRREG